MNNRVGIGVFLLFIVFQTGRTQIPKKYPNLVANPSFELIDQIPTNWFYKGSDFTKISKFWTSPTLTSPDLYGTKIMVPEFWSNQGFGKMTPHGGDYMAGITVYGCVNGKPHCREYLQIELMEDLVPNQKYYIEFYVNQLPLGLRINNLGVAFSKTELNFSNEERINLKPTVKTSQILDASPKNWLKYSATFTANATYSHLIIGNFYSDTLTKTIKSKDKNALNFGYYYIDDVFLSKIDPILKTKPTLPYWNTKMLTVGSKVVLENLYFETDQFDLTPRSIKSLKILLDYMQQNPKLHLEISGHTDSDGDSVYNLELSKQRAKSVVDYLVIKGIAPKRLEYEGYGSKQPRASNDSEFGKQLNRRVEFKVLKL